ncbi:uncharacterized protein C13orf42-like [Megalops cyprinoides]|uniref:uncharacterized protein C13orf42-like n=1 Tax=Megalops cyprinoides TaxID=118141 RepID=UPI001864BBCF|nr:uncharacterized protein C13orf42-like [Megalops cyprinoides]
MLRKINAVFRPNNGQKCRGGFRSEDYHNACTVKLVRSTSMLVVGERRQRTVDSTLKRSKSSVNVESTTALYYYHRQEDRIWLYSQNQDCLKYLEDLVALRRQYTNSVNNLKSKEPKATVSSKKKPPPPPPRNSQAQTSRAKGTAPPIPTEEDTLEFFDAVIASCDPEPKRKSNVDDGHADVDFIVATSTSEHDLHSNWMLRDPRRFSADQARVTKPDRDRDDDRDRAKNKRGENGTGSSRKQLQRNPIHLPKVVESAFQTLRFKPKLRKKD